MRVLCFPPFGLLVSRVSHSLGTTPFALYPLLLLRAPEVFTLRSLLAFDGLVDDIHQLLAEPATQGLDTNSRYPRYGISLGGLPYRFSSELSHASSAALQSLARSE